MNLTLASCIHPLARYDLPPIADFTYGTEEVFIYLSIYLSIYRSERSSGSLAAVVRGFAASA